MLLMVVNETFLFDADLPRARLLTLPPMEGDLHFLAKYEWIRAFCRDGLGLFSLLILFLRLASVFVYLH